MKAAELVVAWLLLFGVCLVWPLLAIANRPTLIFGCLTLVLYLFGCGGDRTGRRDPRAPRPATRGMSHDWLSQTTLLGIVLGYLVFSSRSPRSGRPSRRGVGKGRIRTLTYVSPLVYCTAWTFYGSVGSPLTAALES